VEDIQVREAQRRLQELAVVQCCAAKAVLLTQWLDKGKGRADYAARERNDETAFCKRVKKLTKEEVLEVHAWVKDVVRHGRPSSGSVDWAVPPAPTVVDATLQTEIVGRRRIVYPKLPYRVTHRQAPDGFRWLPTVDHRKQKTAVYMAAVVSLLEECDPKIARCANENCEELFLKSGRQKYHSEACAQQTHFKAWYGRDPEGAREKANVRYERMIQRKKTRSSPSVQTRSNPCVLSAAQTRSSPRGQTRSNPSVLSAAQTRSSPSVSSDVQTRSNVSVQRRKKD